MEQKKQNVVEVLMYRTSIKFEGKWVTTPPSEDIDTQLAYIKRAREKSGSKNLTMNLFTEISWKPA